MSGGNEQRAVGKRRRARQIAVQMLYQHEIGHSTLDQIFDDFALEDYVRETENPLPEDPPAAHPASDGQAVLGAPPPGSKLIPAPPEPPRKPPKRTELENALAYAKQLVTGALTHQEEVDTLIRRFAQNWRLERMPTTDRNILRLAIYEMLYEDKVPKVVIVDEAIELAKRFGSESSGSFVNGLLDGILKAGLATTKDPADTAGETT